MTESIRWQHFEPATLKAAAAADRPMLMLLTVPWCQHCRELLATSFADPQVVAAVHDSVVPVHVDAERRPDVNQRYGTGGWPTIAWLTPDGELIAHQNWLSAEQLRAQIERVRTTWKTNKEDIRRGLRELWAHRDDRSPAPPRTKLRREMVDDIVDAIYEKLDHRYGGFGEGSKFPHPEALDFALVQVSKRDDERMREVVTLTLDRMMESPLHDTVEGGFFRYSRTPDWQTPNHEKLLDQNALVMRAYLEGYQVFGRDAYRSTAEGIAGWMLLVMRDAHTGAFAGSQHGDADTFAGSRAMRERQQPSIDRTVYCGANALAVSSLLKAAAVLGHPEWRDTAMETLRFLLENLYDGQDVFHYWDGTYHLPGMLADQALLIRALIDASQNTGDADLLLPAEAIAERVIARHKAPNGGFFDILHDPGNKGSMRRRNRSILDNATLAESLVRLSYLSRRPEFYDEAVAALESFAQDYKEYGYYVAGYGRAIDLIFYEPLFLTIVGNRDEAASVELRRTALSTYVPSRIVQMLDPRHDPVLLGRSGFTVEATPVVHLTVGRTRRGTARTPDELLLAIETIESERRQSRS
ncbi:MAG: thioredoxin domain-containing protein [Planctomycetes bacterium]|nr:thioredoxin domain-containing protein [Planctomycetota bacterium]